MSSIRLGLLGFPGHSVAFSDSESDSDQGQGDSGASTHPATGTDTENTGHIKSMDVPLGSANQAVICSQGAQALSDAGLEGGFAAFVEGIQTKLTKEASAITEPDEFSDVVLLVEGKRLHTSRALLAAASPVWRQMFTSNFQEKDAKEIPLPGKRYVDVRELLACIHPCVQKAINESTYMQLVPLADEYQMTKLHYLCEQFGLKMLAKCQTNVQTLDHLISAQTYNQQLLCHAAIDKLSNLELLTLQSLPKYKEIEKDVLIKILLLKVKKLERDAKKKANENKTLRANTLRVVKHVQGMRQIRGKIQKD